ncbi:MAG: hypothetical protein K9G33_07455 [Sneathiella sp.]|nr:hypothetical protein [Sneathiella sp.]
MTRKLIVSLAAAAAIAGLSANAFANDYTPKIQKLVDSDLRAWAQSPEVVAAIKEQNKNSATLKQDEIDSQDKKWRAETKGGDKTMINSVLANSLSTYLKDVKEKSQGLYTEIFVMDMKGLNVGQSDPTSDYWQGDEAKWQKTYAVGPKAVLIDDVEFDDSSQTYQSQVSISIVDPASSMAIGAVTVGVNVEMLD